ncbi:MAG: hypothetical protein GF330_09495 [Candidatus Eisenbacteria bacterium]|nr:hypothetical protein [Candidatus Eisenbacteria bacterium]
MSPREPIGAARASRSLRSTIPSPAERRTVRSHTAVLCCGLLALAVLGGCSDYGAWAPEGADTVAVALPASLGGGEAKLFLYRITSLETGERLGVGRTFAMEERRQVRAVLQFEQIDPGTPLLVHFLWINPDGKELFTKDIAIAEADWHSAARRDTLARSLVDLYPEERRLEIESRYGVSPARLEEQFHKVEERRTFKEGIWEVRTYLFRKRLLSTTFELTRPE